MPFFVEDLTINDSNLGVGSEKKFNITLGMKWAKIRSVKLVQLIGGAMNVTLEVWEKDESGYDPINRATYYLRLLRRTIIQAVDEGGEYLEIIAPELLYHDRDNTGELHCRLVNNAGGTASDFAVVFKCGEVGEDL